MMFKLKSIAILVLILFLIVQLGMELFLGYIFI